MEQSTPGRGPIETARSYWPAQLCGDSDRGFGELILSKGQNCPLTVDRIRVCLEHQSSAGQVDLSAVLVTSAGRVRSDKDFVFYNQPVHPAGAVVLGTGADRGIATSLSKVEAEIERIVIGASADGENIAQLRALTAVVLDDATGARLHEFPIIGLVNEQMIVAGELYRRDRAWKFRAIGQGYESGLRGFATDYGISVEDPAVPAQTVPAPTVPAPAPKAPVPVPAAPTPPATASKPATTASYEHPRRDRGLTPPVPIIAQGPPSPPAYKGVPGSAAISSAKPATAYPKPAAVPTAAAKVASSTPAASNLEVRGSERAALVEQINRRVQIYREFCTSIVEAGSDCWYEPRSEMAQIELESQTAIAQIDRVYEELLATITRKYSDFRPSGYVSNPDGANFVPNAIAATREVAQAGFALTKAGRAEQKTALVNRANAVLGARQLAKELKAAARRQAIESMYADVFSRFGRSAEQAMQAAVRDVYQIRVASLPPIRRSATPSWYSPDGSIDVVSGVGIPEFNVGQLVVDRLSATTQTMVPTGGKHERRFAVDLSSVAPTLPVLLNLDRTGGLVTDSAEVVQNLVLEMLSLLPAGRVKIDAVDPVKLGKSLDFLYALGSAGPKIYGERIRTTAAAATKLLEELEEHVAFVQQKYLQGAHETLTDYNIVAGEVSEPYRVVLLFDHPQAFSRDGKSYDDESLLRLRRLAEVGRRAGVFIIAHVGNNSDKAKIPNIANALTGTGTSATDLDGMLGRFSLPTGAAGSTHVAGVGLAYRFCANRVPAPAQLEQLLTHIERELASAADTKVDPGKVLRLANVGQARARDKGIGTADIIADWNDTSTWWRSDVSDRLVSRFGRSGAADVAELVLDSDGHSSALVGGRTGSGKSVLLHSIIMGLTMQYAPEDLDLYLIDFKEGVEFKQYAEQKLPHARVVAIETNREFGLNVLTDLDTEIKERGDAFRSAGGLQNLGAYRRATGVRLPRVVLMIDEFHVLLERDDDIARRGAELIDRIIRQGRAFGVHTMLASQSVSGGAAKIRVALRQIATRLVLASSVSDSEELLSEGNTAAQLLDKPGEGIINTQGGQKDANNRFQCAFWPAEDRERMLMRMTELSAGRFARKPVVFEGKSPVTVDQAPDGYYTASKPNSKLALPLGAPMSVKPPVHIDMDRSGGRNLLIVDPDVFHPIALMAASLAAAGVTVDYVDFAPTPDDRTGYVAALGAGGVNVARPDAFGALLSEVETLVSERIELGDYQGQARVLMLSNVHRSRKLSSDYGSMSEENDRLLAIVKDGAEVGIHVVITADRLASLQRRISQDTLREFGLRAIGPMNENDSRSLVGSVDASSINDSQLIFDDVDLGITRLVRRFQAPSAQWLTALALGQELPAPGEANAHG